MKRSATELEVSLLAKVKREKSYRTLARWAKRDAFCFEHTFQLSDVSSISTNESGSSNQEILDSTPSVLSNSETHNCSFRTDTRDSSDFVEKEDAAENGAYQESNSSAEYSVTFEETDTEEVMIEYSGLEVESDSESTESNELPGDLITVFSSPKLYSNSQMTVDEAVLNFINLYVTNNKTNACLEGDLNFLTSALPRRNRMPKTVFKLFDYVKKQAPPCKVITHYCCKICSFYYGTSKNELCSSCNSDIGCIPFYEINIIDQIQYLFEYKNLVDVLDKANLNRNMDANIITDITDGSEYKRVNINRKQYDLTLILSTDGACIKKSSKANLWPISFMIAEVPPCQRRLFMVYVGIWYAESKPEMNTYLRPLCLKLQSCFEQGGLTWTHPRNNKTFRSKISAPLIVADAPARAMILNMQNHNSTYGCQTCEIKTQRIKQPQPGKRHRRVYKFSSHEWIIRTKKRMLAFGRHAEVTHKIIKSLKGRTVVHVLPGADESTIVFAEFMHLLCLGVIKQLLILWTEKSGEWSIKKYIDIIDDFLVKMKPPNTFGRLPRELKTRKFLKAYEYLYWGLFYSILAVRDFLPDKYFQHWMLLIISLNSLLQEQIRIDPDLERAEVLLTRFVSEFENLYGEAELTYNLHQILHVVLNVRRWGPVWGNSAFAFESFIGILAKMIHGSKHVGAEIINKIKISQGIQGMINKKYIQLAHTPDKCLGKSIYPVTFTEHERYLMDSVDISLTDVKVFARAKIKDQIYTSLLYKTTKMINYCIRCRIAENTVVFGLIKYFLKSQRDILFVLEPLEIDQARITFHRETRTRVDHILPITEGGPPILLKVNNIMSIMKVFLVNNHICIVPKTIRKCLL